MAKIYNSLLLNRIQTEIEKILRKNQNIFCRNRSKTSQILTIRRILEGVHATPPKKTLEATFLFEDLSKAFHSIHRGKMKPIVCVQEHRYHHCEVEIISHDTSNGSMEISETLTPNGEVWRYQKHWLRMVKYGDIRNTDSEWWSMEISETLTPNGEVWRY